MNQTQSKRRKYLFPLAIVVIVAAAALVIVNGNIGNQGASLFLGTDKAALSKNVRNTLPCRMGSTAPEIKVISPNGGEIFTAGQNVAVNWATCNIPANAQILLTLVYVNPNGDGGGAVNVSTPNYGTTPNDGSQVITIPSAVMTGNSWIFGKNYKINAEYAYGTQVARDMSDDTFTINSALPEVSISQW